MMERKEKLKKIGFFAAPPLFFLAFAALAFFAR